MMCLSKQPKGLALPVIPTLIVLSQILRYAPPPPPPPPIEKVLATCLYIDPMFISMHCLLDQTILQVIRSLKRALQPSYDNVTVSWSLPAGWNVDQIPSVIPPLFSGHRLVVYGVLELPAETVDWQKNLKGTVKLSAVRKQVKMEGTNNSVEYSLDFNPLVEAQQQASTQNLYDASNALSLHRLAAKNYIQEQENLSSEWEMKDEQKAAIIEFSTKANVISQFTSFIAVDKESCEPVSGPMPIRLLSAYDNTGNQCLKRAQYMKKRGGAFGNPVCLICCCPCFLFCWCCLWCYGKCSSCFKGAAPQQYLVETKPEATPLAASEFDNLSEADHAPKHAEATTELWKTSADHKSRFMKIISLQKASGSWELSGEFAEACDSTKDDLKGKCQGAFTEGAENATEFWATALALVLLVRKFASQKNEWEMVKLKGKRWLECNKPSNANIEEIFAAACKFFSVDYPIEIWIKTYSVFEIPSDSLTPVTDTRCYRTMLTSEEWRCSLDLRNEILFVTDQVELF